MPARDRGARQRDLEVVAAGLGGLERACAAPRRTARIDVAAAGQHQAVDAREDLLGAFGAGHDFDGSPPARRTDSR